MVLHVLTRFHAPLSLCLQIKVGDNNTKQPVMFDIKGAAALRRGGEGCQCPNRMHSPPLLITTLPATPRHAGRVMWAFWNSKKGMGKEQVTGEPAGMRKRGGRGARPARWSLPRTPITALCCRALTPPTQAHPTTGHGGVHPAD